MESWYGQQLAHPPPPNFSLHVSHRIYANLRIVSGAGWGELPPFAPHPVRGDANGRVSDSLRRDVRSLLRELSQSGGRLAVSLK